MATIHPFALASRTISSGEVVAYKFNGTGDTQTFSFKLSSNIKNPTACNTTGSYTIDPHMLNAAYMISILLNLHNHTMNGWMKQPAVAASGTGECKLSPNAEDARLIIVTDSNHVAFGYSVPYGFTKQIGAIAHSYPVILNMGRRYHATEPVVIGYYNDLCVKKISIIEANRKWAVSGFSGAGSSNPDSIFWNTIGSEANKFLNGVTRTATCFDLGNLADGIQFYSEYKTGSVATAMWRNEGGRFHGAILHKEKGKWKMYDAR